MNTDNLKAIRKKSGKTQKEVAEGIGIGQGTYKNYETGASMAFTTSRAA